LGHTPSSGVVGRFVSVTQVGDAASVQPSFDSDKLCGRIDFHGLLRINGVWKITNKTATHSSRYDASNWSGQGAVIIGKPSLEAVEVAEMR
jgi:hypothetical protein